MSNYRRAKTPGATYFFTVVTHQRQPLFQIECARTALRDAIHDVRQLLPFQIDAWVLLPDHLHAIWTLPPGDADFSQRWSKIKRQTSRACRHLVNQTLLTPGQITDGEFGFWQRRFWEHQIRDDADFAAHADYIHWNPVKHGLVKSVGDWPHSTFHRFLANRKYTGDWTFTERESNVEFGEHVGGQVRPTMRIGTIT